MRALEAGAPMDIIFQSLAGTEAGNRSFGIDVALLDEARVLIHERGTLRGRQLMYFETGQGSELSANAHAGADQLTLEARCYGLARRYNPFLVNTVGPALRRRPSDRSRRPRDHFMEAARRAARRRRLRNHAEPQNDCDTSPPCSRRRLQLRACRQETT
jgi:hypothetical protein